MITVGIDEVGRGCWAGPVVAGAVILRTPIDGLTDSKLLSAKQRQKLNQAIIDSGAAIGIGWVEASVVDKLGLTAAVDLAMQRALNQLPEAYDEIIIDGDYQYLKDNPKARSLIKADLTVPVVSAASVVAKVARDAYMTEVAVSYPVYGFEKHVGYGTALHAAMLREHGITVLHRKSFKPIASLLQ